MTSGRLKSTYAAICTSCGYAIAIQENGSLRFHTDGVQKCPGTGRKRYIAIQPIAYYADRRKRERQERVRVRAGTADAKEKKKRRRKIPVKAYNVLRPITADEIACHIETRPPKPKSPPQYMSWRKRWFELTGNMPPGEMTKPGDLWRKK